MRVNSFSLLVPEGREKDSGHIEIRHNTQYTLRLSNHNFNCHCDATVMVDGKEIGSFRVNAGGSILLERPADDTGRFTFFETKSQEALAAGVATVAEDLRGLIQVIFRPERRRQVQKQVKTCFGFAPDGEEKTSGGVTGLTGQSQQQFHEVAKLDYEPGAEVTISLRLVSPGVRELKPVASSNPVPQPV